MLRNRTAIILFSSGISLMLLAFIFNNFSALKIEQIAQRASSKIEQKSLLCHNALNLNASHTFVSTNKPTDELFEKEGIALYQFKKDSMFYWNNSRIPVNTSL